MSILDSSLGEMARLYEQASDFNSQRDICHTENWCLMPDGRRLYLVIDTGGDYGENKLRGIACGFD